jgi:S-adenosylmethionine decarboxylase
MKNVAPDIFRQRLLLEGFYTIEVNRDTIDRFLRGLADHLDLRIYGDPVIYSPEGEGRGINQGFDAFVPLIDSGISLYVWSARKFFSIIVYSCKSFHTETAVDYTRDFFAVSEDLQHEEF